MRLTIYSLLAALALGSCGNSSTGETATDNTQAPPKENRLEKMSWVLGTWENETPDGVFTEYWEKTSETLYTGHGSLVSPKGDTMFSEYITLEQVNDTLYYKPIVSGQNDGKAVVFTEKTAAANEFVFENPGHDFPQRIIYKKTSDTTLYARIEGVAEGQERQEEFRFKKAKP